MSKVVAFCKGRPASRLMLELARIDVTWLKKAAEILPKVEVSDREEFAQWVALVVQRLGRADLIATEFGISPATLSRWMSGQNVPPIYARQAVLDKLRTLALSRAEELTKAA